LLTGNDSRPSLPTSQFQKGANVSIIELSVPAYTRRVSAESVPSVIDVADVAKSYGSVQALQGVTVRIAAGQAVALIGPNGAGKSTFVEILMGLRRPDRGRVTVLGCDVVRNPRGHVERLGVQLQETRLFTKLTPREFLNFFSRIYPRLLPIEEVARRLDLTAFLDRDIGSLSGGQRRRVALALAVINDPDVIILDEPTVGLDPIARLEFWRFIRQLREDGKTLLFSTHYMEEAEALATEVLMISGGRLIAQGTAEEIIALAQAGGTTTLNEAYEYLVLGTRAGAPL
jgi:ABC-2 type transport system ATP-binding protein